MFIHNRCHTLVWILGQLNKLCIYQESCQLLPLMSKPICYQLLEHREATEPNPVFDLIQEQSILLSWHPAKCRHGISLAWEKDEGTKIESMLLSRQCCSGGLDVQVERCKGGHSLEVTLPLRMRIWRWEGIRSRYSSMHRLWTSTMNLQRFVSNRWRVRKLRKIWYIDDTGILLKGILGNVFNKYDISRNVGLY